MSAEPDSSDWEAGPFDAVKAHICATVRQLDAAVGRPPFCNPSTAQCRSLAQFLVHLLRHAHNKSRVAALEACPEVNMTLPVLCASLVNGSEGRKPCLVLMELLLEALVYMHSVSLYPLQTTLSDAKEVLPMSPVTLRLFVVTGFINVETMCFFLGVKYASRVEARDRNPTKGKCQKTSVAKQRCEQETSDAIHKMEAGVIPVDMLNAALDMVLPPDCMKVLLSLFDSPSKFQQTVGSDSKLAARVLNVYGDLLLPNLRPLSLLRCLDVSLLDIFVDVVQMHDEKMTLLTEPLYAQTSLAEWSPEKLSSLIRYSVERNVRREEAFASLVVYVFLCKVLALWGKPGLSWFPLEEEVRLWTAVLNVVQLMLPLSTESALTLEEERLLKSLGVLAESVMRRHTMDTVTAIACAMPQESIGAVLDMLTLLLHAKWKLFSVAATSSSSFQAGAGEGGGDGGKRKKKEGKRNAGNNKGKDLVPPMRSDSMIQYCQWIGNVLGFLFWLTSPTVVVPDTCNPWGVVESLAAVFLHVLVEGVERVRRVDAWESFLNLLVTVMSLRTEKNEASRIGKKTTAALLTAVRVTCRLECCGVMAQRMPEVYDSSLWPLNGYKVLLDAWLTGKTHTDDFYAGTVLPSPTESIELVLRLLDNERLYKLAHLLLDTEQTTDVLLPALEKVALQESGDRTVANVGFTGLARLRRELLNVVEDQQKMRTEQRQKEDERRRLTLLADTQRAEELREKSTAFEKEMEGRRHAKREEMMRIHQLREEQERKKELRSAEERQKRNERRRKIVATLQEMTAKTRAERVAEHRERLLRYRKRVATVFRTSSFLESLHLTSSQVMRLMSTLQPYLHSMTPDDLLECVVTGNREVPSDMHVEDDDCNGTRDEKCLGEAKEDVEDGDGESLCFWDSVMRIMARQSVKETGDHHENTNEELGVHVSSSLCSTTNSTTRGGGTFSFHRSVAGVLNLFDYSMGTNETLPDPLPSLSVRAASRLLEGAGVLVDGGFCNGREALLLCQQRGLCVLHEDVCTLTPLGFRYHYPFHDPEQMLDFQLAQRRGKAKEMLERRRQAGDCAEAKEKQGEEEGRVCLSDTTSWTTDDDVVYFADEFV